MMKTDDLHEQLEALLLQLVENVDLSDEELATFTRQLCDIYNSPSFRHRYSRISLVLETFSPDQRDALSQHIQSMQNDAQKYVADLYDKTQQDIIISKIAKLCDHVDLECLRLARIDKVEHIGRTASNELSAASGKLQETEDKATELRQRISSYQEQSVTILGIFAGLVITFSGIVQIVTSSLSNLSNVTALKITYFVGLSLFFLFNVVFLLMYCISKISGSSIAANCKHRYCENCKACNTAVGRLKKKYPYVFWFDVIGAVFCSVLCLICK